MPLCKHRRAERSYHSATLKRTEICLGNLAIIIGLSFLLFYSQPGIFLIKHAYTANFDRNLGVLLDVIDLYSVLETI